MPSINTPLLNAVASLQKQRQQNNQYVNAAMRLLQQNSPTGGYSSSQGSPPVGVFKGKLSSNPGINKLINYGERFIGTPYQWGGTTPRGFDCSGFVQYVYSHFGINLPRVSRDQAAYGKPVSAANARAGDLVYYGQGSGVHHIGIYLGGGKFLEAPHSGDSVKIAPVGASVGGFTRVIR